MHELSIAMSLIDLALEESARHAGVITALHLKLGPLSGVIKPALLSAFALAIESTPLENSELIIEEMPILAFCPACKKVQHIPSPQHLCCPLCNTPTPELRSGRQLEFTALEMTNDPTNTHPRSPQTSAQAE